jgi:hypothetical protein
MVSFCKACFPRADFSREQKRKQFDWLATNTDDITTQSHSLFACSRNQRREQFDWLATNTDVITTQSHSLLACSREKKSPRGKPTLN